MVNKIKDSFCDLSLLIDLKLGYESTFDNFLSTQNKIFIADTIKYELENLLKGLEEYQYFYTDLFTHNEKIEVVYAKDFSSEELSVIEATLAQFNMNVSLIDKDLCPDLGEFVSSLYSKYKNINVVRTSDNKFVSKYGDNYIFKNIKFINLYSTLDEFLENNTKKETLKKIKLGNKIFNKHKSEYRFNETKKKLMEKFKNHRPS